MSQHVVATRPMRTATWIEIVCAALLSATMPFGAPGELLALAIIFVWLAEVRHYRFAVPLIFSLALCVFSGIVLHALNPGGGTFDQSGFLSDSLLPVHALLAFAGLLWARSVIGIRHVALIYGTVSVAHAFITNPAAADSADWKFHYAWPLVIVIMAVFDRRGTWPLIACTFSLIAVALLAEWRGLIAFIAIGLIILLLKPALMRLVSEERRRINVGLAITLTAAAAAGVILIYSVLEQALLSGLLGAEAQLKTVAQIHQYGSLAAGARTETPMTVNLMLYNPFGFGPGYVPSQSEYAASVYAAVQEASRSYLDTYTFNGHIKLHSFWGDLWVNFGLMGLLTAALMMVVSIIGVVVAARARDHVFMLIMFGVIAAWHVLFSPIYSNLQDVAFIAALIVPIRTAAGRST